MCVYVCVRRPPGLYLGCFRNEEQGRLQTYCKRLDLFSGGNDFVESKSQIQLQGVEFCRVKVPYSIFNFLTLLTFCEILHSRGLSVIVRRIENLKIDDGSLSSCSFSRLFNTSCLLITHVW